MDLRPQMSAVIDDRLTAQYPSLNGSIYSADADWSTGSPSFPRNPASWTYDLDFTFLSPISGRAAPDGYSGGPSLVTPRHAFAVCHYRFAVGTYIYFGDRSNVGEFYQVTNEVHCPVTDPANEFQTGPDLQIVQLDRDVAAGVKICQVLPANWRNFIAGNGAGLPILFTNSYCDGKKYAYLYDIQELEHENRPLYPVATTFTTTTDPKRFATLSTPACAVTGHDSGQPSILFATPDDPIIIYPGACNSFYRSAFNALIAAFPDNGGYQLREYDLQSLKRRYMASSSISRVSAGSGGPLNLSTAQNILTIAKPISGEMTFRLVIRFTGLNTGANLIIYEKYGAAAAIAQDGGGPADGGTAVEHELEVKLSSAASGGVGGVDCLIQVKDSSGLSTAGSFTYELFKLLTGDDPDNTTIGRLGTDYTTGRAGKIDNLDAAVSTRAQPSDVPAPVVVESIRG